MTSQNELYDSSMEDAEFQPPKRISWKRHLELETQTVEQLLEENRNLDTDTEHYYQLVCRLAKDLRDHGVESEALNEVLDMGWLEEYKKEAALTGDQLERQKCVDIAIHTLLNELADFEVEWDISLIGAVRDCIASEFQSRGIMTGMEFYPSLECGGPTSTIGIRDEN